MRKSIGVIALVVALVTGVAVPAGIGLNAYSTELRAASFKASLAAQHIAGYMATRTIDWQSHRGGVAAAMDGGGHGLHDVRKLVFDTHDTPVLAIGAPQAWPTITRSAPIVVAGTPVGRIEIEVSVRQRLLVVSFAMVLGMAFGLLVYIGIRVFPLRALDQTVAKLRQREEEFSRQNLRFDAAVKHMSQGLCMFDATQRLVVSNERYAELYAIPPEILRPGITLREILQHRIANGIYSGNSPEDYIEERLAWVARGAPGQTIQILHDGRTIAISHQPMADGGWLTTHSDITEIRQYEDQLAEQNRLFNLALENMSQGLCMFDADKRLVVCNKRYVEIYGVAPELAEPGTPFRKILEHRVASGVYCGGVPEQYIEERLDAVAEDVPSTKIQELNDGRVIAIVHRPIIGGGWLATHENVTEHRRIAARITHMAHHDALTDLPNRTLLRERIEEALKRARRGENLAVICLDLDRFKNVNDTLGHAIGDELLKAVADRLRGAIRDTDMIARLGGDEFAILQVPVGLSGEAATLAERINRVVAEPYELNDHQVVVGTSAGIALAPRDGNDPDELMKNADLALYRAKNDGGGSYHFFEPEMDALMQARRALELDLRKALDDGEFELYYQPFLNLETNRVTGFEALLRWQHSNGTVPPGAFIPLAEETGLICRIGEWVLQEACAEAANWPDDIVVAVNISPVQFKARDLVQVVTRALAASGLSSSRLELEVTESVLLQDDPATMATLHRLHDLGVRISMDDFGTGYSSLSYLRSFPFDKIKIDRSFIGDISGRDAAVAIVQAVAQLGGRLGIETTAEGVETMEQLEAIREEGCTEMQGFLISPPRPAAELPQLFLSRLDWTRTPTSAVAEPRRA